MASVKSTHAKFKENKLKLKRTSSLNNYFMCHYCERKFLTKKIIEEHVITCVSDRTCKWCNIVFRNRGNLFTHTYYTHNNKSLKSKQLSPNKCAACNKSFSDKGALKYHIRQMHFNLVTKIPMYKRKQVNQIWFEKVLNTDTIVEIKKTGDNVLLIRKFSDERDVKLQEYKVTLDLTDFYPTGNLNRKCDICDVVVLEQDLKKHYDEKHGDVKEHLCKSCNMTFKRLYFFARHTCPKKKRVRTKKPCEISDIDRLTPIV